MGVDPPHPSSPTLGKRLGGNEGMPRVIIASGVYSSSRFFMAFLGRNSSVIAIVMTPLLSEELA